MKTKMAIFGYWYKNSLSSSTCMIKQEQKKNKKKKSETLVRDETSQWLPCIWDFHQLQCPYFLPRLATRPNKLPLDSCQFYRLAFSALQHTTAILITVNTASRPTEITVNNSSKSEMSVKEREAGIRETDVTLKSVAYVGPKLAAHAWKQERSKFRARTREMACVLLCAYSRIRWSSKLWINIWCTLMSCLKHSSASMSSNSIWYQRIPSLRLCPINN